MSYSKVVIKTDNKSLRKNGTTPVYVQYIHEGKIIRFRTGELVKPQHFKNGAITKGYGSDYNEANDNIQNLKLSVDKIIREANYKQIHPTTSYVKEQVELARDQVAQKSIDLIDYLDQYIEVRESDYTFNAVKDFKSLRSHLEGFSNKVGYNLQLDKINNVFFSRFSQYLFTETNTRLTTNTVAKYFKVLRTFMNWLTRSGKNNNLDYKEFRIKETVSEVIYLTKAELDQFYFHTFDSEKLSRVRDLFVLQCCTGLRFSDAQNIDSSNLVEGELKIQTIKTRDNLKIPLNKYSSKILSRYFDEGLPLPNISNQKMNDYLKEAAKEAGLSRTIIETKFYGRERVEERTPLYKIISSHCGRRTFVSLSLEMGIPAQVVMSLTGHKNYATMKKYLAVSDKSKNEHMTKMGRIERVNNPQFRNIEDDLRFIYGNEIDAIPKSIIKKLLIYNLVSIESFEAALSYMNWIFSYEAVMYGLYDRNNKFDMVHLLGDFLEIIQNCPVRGEQEPMKSKIYDHFDAIWTDYMAWMNGDNQKISYKLEKFMKLFNPFRDLKNKEETQELYSITETATILKVSRQTVYAMIKDNRLKATRIGESTQRIKRSEIDRIISRTLR